MLLKILKTTVIIILFIFASFQGYKIFQLYQDKQIVQTQMVHELSAKVRLQDISGELLKWIDKEIFGKDKQHFKKYVQKIKTIQKKIHSESLGFLALSFGILLISLWQYNASYFAITTTFLSLLCLTIGLSIPVLTIESSQELPVLGETIFQFESKSIWGSIQQLLTSKNWLVGCILLVFSVLLPLAKSLFTAWANLPYAHSKPQAIARLLGYFGKWSMTDVFVVAILVVFFAGSNHSLTKSHLEYGVYFFTAYVLLAMIANHITNDHK